MPGKNLGGEQHTINIGLIVEAINFDLIVLFNIYTHIGGPMLITLVSRVWQAQLSATNSYLDDYMTNESSDLFGLYN